MIKQFEDGLRLITLGEGTTNISQVIQKGETESSGICFSTSFDENGKPSNDSVIINTINMQGVMSLYKALVELLKTWYKDEELVNQLDDLSKLLDKFWG